MTELDADQKEEYHEAWYEYDPKRTGVLDARTLGFVLRYLGQNPSDAELNDMCHKYGQAGRMQLQSFLSMMGEKTKDLETEEGLIRSFQVFDKDGKGQISASELRAILSNQGDRLSDEQVNKMMNEALQNDEGNLDYRDFVRMMMKR